MGAMGEKTFFRLALLAPLVVPLIMLPFSFNMVLGLLFLSLSFGGAQYLIFAVVMFLVVGRQNTVSGLNRVVYLSPVIFLPFVIVGWLLSGYFQRSTNPLLVGIWDAVPLIILYALIIGYAYVGVVLVIRYIFTQLGWLKTSFDGIK